jgi:hypothetical protein
MRCRSDARENAFETSLWRECVAIGLCRHKRPELGDMTAVHVSTDQEGHAPVCCRAFDSICHRVLSKSAEPGYSEGTPLGSPHEWVPEDRGAGHLRRLGRQGGQRS